MPVQVVAARLGHADPGMTFRVHARVIDERLQAEIFAREVDGAACRGAVGKIVSTKATFR